MKRLLISLILGLAFTPFVANCEYVEIKTPEGTYGYYKSTYYPYVCYQRRVRIFRDGYQYLKYEGCMQSRYPCRSIGMLHFGRYPNSMESERALRRCINSTPRFVD